MTIPDFETLMTPMLIYASDKQEHSYRDTIDFLANEYNLSDNEKKELLPSGRMPIFDFVVRMERKNDSHTISNKTFDFSKTTIRQLIQDGYDESKEQMIRTNF